MAEIAETAAAAGSSATSDSAAGPRDGAREEAHAGVSFHATTTARITRWRVRAPPGLAALLRCVNTWMHGIYRTLHCSRVPLLLRKPQPWLLPGCWPDAQQACVFVRVLTGCCMRICVCLPDLVQGHSRSVKTVLTPLKMDSQTEHTPPPHNNSSNNKHLHGVLGAKPVKVHAGHTPHPKHPKNGGPKKDAPRKDAEVCCLLARVWCECLHVCLFVCVCDVGACGCACVWVWVWVGGWGAWVGRLAFVQGQVRW
jgi:hypothetical protein